MLGINQYSILGMLFSMLGVFALSFADDDEDETVVFKNQDQLDDMVEKRLAKQKGKLLTDSEDKIKKLTDDFEEKLSDLNDTVKELKNKKPPKDEDDPKLQKLQDTIDELVKDNKKVSKERDDVTKEAEKVKATNKEKAIENAVISVLSEQKAVSPKDIFLIIKEKGNIILDDSGNVIPVFPGTEDQLNGKDGNPMELSEHIGGWLKEHPHFVSASGLRGSDTASASRTAIKRGENGEDDHEPTMAEILRSDEVKKGDQKAFADGSLQHGGEDIQQG